MSYRKITVEGKEYLWSTNGVVTRVRLGRHGSTTEYLNSEWGTPLRNRSIYGEPKFIVDGGCSNGRYVLDEDYGGAVTGFVIASGDVKGMILGERKWKNHPCSLHPYETVTGLSADPFDETIHHKRTLVENCRVCAYASYQRT